MKFICRRSDSLRHKECFQDRMDRAAYQRPLDSPETSISPVL